MAKTTKAKPKKDTLFEAEDFDVEEETLDQETEQEEEIPEPEDINEAELEEVEPIIDVNEAIEEEDDDDIIASPAHVISLDHLEEEKEHEEAEVSENAEEAEATKSVVIKCPHCLEEVLDMEICPLCGSKLRPGNESLGSEREDTDNILEGYEEELDEGQDYPKRTAGASITDPDVDLFGGLPYQDQYSPITSDSI